MRFPTEKEKARTCGLPPKAFRSSSRGGLQKGRSSSVLVNQVDPVTSSAIRSLILRISAKLSGRSSRSPPELFNHGFADMESLGAVYSRASSHIYGDWNSCGKVMGLAEWSREWAPSIAYREVMSGPLEDLKVNWERLTSSPYCNRRWASRHRGDGLSKSENQKIRASHTALARDGKSNRKKNSLVPCASIISDSHVTLWMHCSPERFRTNSAGVYCAPKAEDQRANDVLCWRRSAQLDSEWKDRTRVGISPSVCTSTPRR